MKIILKTAISVIVAVAILQATSMAENNEQSEESTLIRVVERSIQQLDESCEASSGEKEAIKVACVAVSAGIILACAGKEIEESKNREINELSYFKCIGKNGVYLITSLENKDIVSLFDKYFKEIGLE